MKGDDGETYVCGGSILSLAVEQLDLVSVGLSKGTGKAEQLPSSIYKVGRYPGPVFDRIIRQPKGTLHIEKGEDQVIVTCGGEFRVECNADKSWHLFISLPSENYRAELWHRPQGYPLWYGREKPSFLTQHSVTYGYNWSGKADGWLEIGGKRSTSGGSASVSATLR